MPAGFLSVGILSIKIFVERGGAFSLWLLNFCKADKLSTFDWVDATRLLNSGDGGISTKTCNLLLCRPRLGVDEVGVVYAMCETNKGRLEINQGNNKVVVANKQTRLPHSHMTIIAPENFRPASLQVSNDVPCRPHSRSMVNPIDIYSMCMYLIVRIVHGSF